MSISPVSPIAGFDPVGGIKRTDTNKTANQPEGGAGASFGDAMIKALGQVNKLQQQADDMAVKLATGDVEDVHKAMIAMNKARLAFDFTLQVRNKVIEAYQEIMRMQV